MLESSAAPSRRGFLAGAAGAALVAIGGTGPAQAAPARFGAGLLSGLPWNSGCGLNGISAFEAYRGRRADSYTLWCAHNTWDDIGRLPGGFRTVAKLPGRISVGFAMLPGTASAVTNPGNWKLAAKGTFDGYYTRFAQNLAASGRTDIIVRVGWESNRTFPWYGGSDPQRFKDTFKRVADILRRYNPGVLIDWTNVKKGAQKGSVLTLYPGDDAVDIISCDYYDGWPALNTEQIWAQQYNATYYGGPWGIGAWLAFAKSRGKLFGCPEWGISAGEAPGTIDNPLYIQKMHDFFAANSAYIAYENYFNQKPRHQLTPSNQNPLASAAYRQLWGVSV